MMWIKVHAYNKHDAYIKDSKAISQSKNVLIYTYVKIMSCIKCHILQQ